MTMIGLHIVSRHKASDLSTHGVSEIHLSVEPNGESTSVYVKDSRQRQTRVRFNH